MNLKLRNYILFCHSVLFFNRLLPCLRKFQAYELYTQLFSYICIMHTNNIDNFDPKTCISGKVMRLNRMTGNIFRKYISPFGVTNSQVSLLFILSKNDGLTQKELSDFSKLEKSSVNRNLKRLFEQSYLTRSSFPSIKITEKGKQLVNSIIPEWNKAMTEMRTLLGDDGEEALNLVLSKLNSKS